MLAAMAASMTLAACTQEAPPAPEIVRPVRAAQVNEASEIAGRYFPGRAKATREVDLAFRVSGPLVERPVGERRRSSCSRELLGKLFMKLHSVFSKLSPT